MRLRDYALPLDRDRRFAPANPAIADMKSHAAAGRGTGDTPVGDQTAKTVSVYGNPPSGDVGELVSAVYAS